MSDQDKLDPEVKLHHTLDNTAPRPVAPPPDIAQVHPRHTEAMKIFQQFTANRHMGVSIDIADIVGELPTTMARATFPEALFVTHFLPVFAGITPPTQHVNMTTWIDKVSGDGRNPVDICDPEGGVMYTVPPMFDISILDQARSGGANMTLIERQFSRLKEIDAKGSQTFLRTTLASLHVKDKPTPELFSNTRAWNAILERYGMADRIINLVPLDSDPNKDAAPASTNPTSDLADYELDTD